MAPRPRRAAPVIFLVTLLLLAGASPATAQTDQTPGQEETPALTFGRPVERTIAGQQQHTYSVEMKAGQYLHVGVHQRGVDVTLKLVSPGGKELLHVDSPNGTAGHETLSFVAETDGKFLVIVSRLQYAAPPGRYALIVTPPHAPEPADKLRIEAERVFREAGKLNPYYYKEDYGKALAKYEEARSLWEKIGDKYWQAVALMSSGLVSQGVNDDRISLEANSRALLLYRSLEDYAGECRALINIGNHHLKAKKYPEALDSFNQALTAARRLGDKVLEVSALQSVALAEWDFGRKRAAVSLYLQSWETDWPAAEQVGDDVVSRERALELLNEALKFERAEKGAAGEENIFFKLGWVSGLNTYGCGGGVEYYRKALAAGKKNPDGAEKAAFIEKLRQSFVVAARKCEGQWGEDALHAFEGLLEVERERNNPADVAVALARLGDAYLNNGQKWKAVESYRSAVTTWRALNDPASEAEALNRLGDIFNSYYGTENALECWREAAAIKRKLDDKRGEVLILFKQARFYLTRGKHQEAAQSYEALLKIPVERGAEIDDISSVNLGTAYFRLNRIEDAISRLESVVARHRSARGPEEQSEEGLPGKSAESGDPINLIAMNNLGEVYRSTGQPQRAIELYSTAIESAWLPAREETIIPQYTDLIVGSGYDSIQRYVTPLERENRTGVAEAAPSRRPLILRASIIYNNLGLAYLSLGEYELALKRLQNAAWWAVYSERRDYSGDVQEVIGNNLALVYKTLARYDKALPYYQRNLEAMRQAGDRAGVALALNNLGALHQANGKHEEALARFKQALEVMREVKDRRGEGAALNNMGDVYISLGREKDAIEYFNQALDIRRQIEDRSGEADTLSNLGSAHLSLKNYEQAVGFYEQALVIKRFARDRLGEATTLHNLMLTHGVTGSPALAIFYGKQAVNIYQALRDHVERLDEASERSFLASVEKTYRRLSDLLIESGRFPEAQQILSMLKEEEFLHFVRRDAGEIKKLSKRADLREDERKALERYEQLADRLTSIELELDRLEFIKNRLPAGKPFEHQAKYDELNEQLRDANKAFRLFLEKELAGEIGRAAKREVEVDRALQGKLAQWGAGTVALYTVVGADRYRVILTTAKSQTDGKTEIKAAELNKKIFAFREALQDPSVDPRPLGKELYDILVKPVEQNLGGAQTLIWSLDGTLRYIPLAALSPDGEQYLAQKYRIVVITSATRQTMSEQVASVWRALGLGVTQESKVTEPFGTALITFGALPGVERELQAIISNEDARGGERGVLTGKRLVDGDFTAAEVERRLGQREGPARKYNVVHFATHFHLGDDTANSFMLLGKNQAMTLEQVSDSPEMNFTDVELVTLSACNTGYGGLVAAEAREKERERLTAHNGREVDSLAAFIEGRGAKAVLATLWPVADESTELLMAQFYRVRKENAGVTKAEAVQMAQRAMIEGRLAPTSADDKQRAELASAKGAAAKGAPPFKYDPAKPYAHPYYWAPFILIGNWR